MRPLRLLATLVAATALALSTFGSAAAIEGLDTPASDLRVSLDRLLSEHVFLTVQALQAGISDNEQFAAAAEALEANTVELEDAIAGIYNEEAGQRFGDLWRAHIGYVVDYTRARQAADEEAEQRAIDGLGAYQADFASFLAGSNPGLSEETLHHLLEDHLAQLQQVANLQLGDYDEVYVVARQAYGHMFELGDGLSHAIAEQFPDTFSGSEVAFGPAIDLQVTLDRLLGEHAFFALEVMRLATLGAEPERAASEALASNGESLRAAVADIYGGDAGRGFADIWEQHNGYYVDYVRARLTGDEAGAETARTGLEDFSGHTADFLASANDLFDADVLRTGLAVHTDHLLAQVDAYDADDYVAAFAIGREAYLHMGAISDLLATGIVNQFPERFLPDTAVGSAPGTTSLMGWLAVVVAAVAGAWRAWARGRLATLAAGLRPTRGG
ncbi:MAG: copper amine oxidase [Candidatus Limnocylindria bacterium]